MKDFEKYVELIISMSIDYLQGELTEDAYLSNLVLIIARVEKDKTKRS